MIDLREQSFGGSGVGAIGSIEACLYNGETDCKNAVDTPYMGSLIRSRTLPFCLELDRLCQVSGTRSPLRALGGVSGSQR